jgi:hypothetical protein
MSMLTSIIAASVMATNLQRFESQEIKIMAWKQQDYTDQTNVKSSFDFSMINKEQQDIPERTEEECLHVTNDIQKSNTLPRKFRYTNNLTLKISNNIKSSHETVSNTSTSSSNELQNTVPTKESSDSGNDVQSDTIDSENLQTNCSQEQQEQVAEQNSDSPPPPIPPRNSIIIAPARPPLKHRESQRSQLSGTSRVSFLRHSYAETGQRQDSFRHHRRSSYHYLPVSAGVSSNNSFEVKTISVPEFQAPPVPKIISVPNTPVSPISVALPTRKKGKKYTRPEIPMAYFVSLMKWLLFIGSRLIALCGFLAFFYNSLVAMLVALGCVLLHWIIINAVISVNCDPTTKSRWKICILSFGSLYCLIELGTKFTKFTRIIAVYWPLCFLENIVASFMAFKPHQVEDITNWWNAYLFYTMCTTYILSTACLLFNTYIIMPQTYIVYDENE